MYATLHRLTIIWSLHRSTFVHLATKSTIFLKFVDIDRLMSCVLSKHGTTRTLSVFVVCVLMGSRSPIDHAHGLLVSHHPRQRTTGCGCRRCARSSSIVVRCCEQPYFVSVAVYSDYIILGNQCASSLLYIILAWRPSHLRSSMTYRTLSTALSDTMNRPSLSGISMCDLIVWMIEIHKGYRVCSTPTDSRTASLNQLTLQGLIWIIRMCDSTVQSPIYQSFRSYLKDSLLASSFPISTQTVCYQDFSRRIELTTQRRLLC